MTNRFADLFARKPTGVLNLYLTAGYPGRHDTVPLLRTLAAAGADILEIGVPFSDPLADGPVIQRTSAEALRNGMTLDGLLDEPAVRNELAARGRPLPDDVRFVAGLHDTTTDEVTLFDLDELPASHEADLTDLRGWLREAGDRARAERAPRLGLPPLPSAGLFRAFRAKANDWAETRPEWGLADNAALIVAPRERTRAIDLRGRAFLHEYRQEEDVGYAVLEAIMTAPLLVAHWINLQYYASTVDNGRYGSGNKVLHNVVGGRVGLFEGNGGDLRIGLSLQSVHDGITWRHTPLRLTVFIEAPREAIDAILGKHAVVRALVDNGWLTLVQLDAAEPAAFTYRAGGWVPGERTGAAL